MKLPQTERLPSGSIRVRVQIDGRRISRTFATEKDALAFAATLKAGKTQAGASTTLTRAIDDYIDSRRNILSPSTIRGYRTIQRNRFQTMMPRQLSGISDSQWTRAVNQEARLCSAKTLKNSWLFICSVLRDSGHQPPKVSLPQVIVNERPFLEPEEIPIFVSAVHGTSVEIPALLALSSMRCSEILALSWDNVDLKNDVIHVSGAVVPDEHHKMIEKKENKNSASRRTIPIFLPELRAALQTGGDGHIVAMTAQTIRSGVNRICADNHLPEVGIHGLRHSFASLCYHLNIPEKTVMQIGGWSDDTTMRRIYTHLAQRDVEKNIGSLKDFFCKNGHENGHKNG